MPVAIKTLLNYAGGLGSVCAVAIPVSLTRGGNYSIKPKVSLTKCSNTDTGTSLSKMDYGDDVQTSICWKEVNNSSEGNSTVESKYTSLFRDNWGHGSTNWEIGAEGGNWKDNCNLDTTTGWEIKPSNESGQLKYLGLCENSASTSNVPFIKKQKAESGRDTALKFWRCESSCWSVSQNTTGKTTYTAEQPDKWKEIGFYKT
ncbi:hypothetical protein [Candidatus Mycoplasma haematominutum]|uniref:Uncharacterized protein n=1 Tax=Candidatus Mycoplasma haematominutum 'Birmingham 1' TaxID=1116213 RepID=G8C2R3_9MOLU|nr:hypothetical protein [Candidatus Mycoplasma haematominutum]CCE66611.1 hypothetical protein MHM_00930 [Candidatus Mycoplasma haematominutum 'Birmingham 1']